MLKLKHTTGLLALTALLAAGGCASTSDLEKLAARVDAVESQAAAAQEAADKAAAAAADAASTADSAQRTADAAMAKAEGTEAKIDRMFKKAMYK